MAVTFPFDTHQMKVVSKGDPKQKDLIIMGGIPTPEFGIREQEVVLCFAMKAIKEK